MTTFEIIQIIIGSGLGFGVLRLIFIAGKTTQKLEVMSTDISQIKGELKDINRDLRTLDSRLSRIEGAFFEPRHWEPKLIAKEDKKEN